MKKKFGHSMDFMLARAKATAVTSQFYETCDFILREIGAGYWQTETPDGK